MPVWNSEYQSPDPGIPELPFNYTLQQTYMRKDRKN